MLSQHPAVDSRVRADHRRLTDFLRAVEEDAEPALARIAGDVALELTVGMPAGVELTRHRDLDNYLLPVVGRLGQRRIPAVFARKVRADESTLTVAPARYVTDDSPPMVRIRTTGACERPEWKDQVREAWIDEGGPGSPHPGALAVDIAFVVSSILDWTRLWKPTIDAIAGPLLGIPDPESPWSPNDDRITDLGLHRTIDDHMGQDVLIDVWWSGVPDPERA